MYLLPIALRSAPFHARLGLSVALLIALVVGWLGLGPHVEAEAGAAQLDAGNLDVPDPLLYADESTAGPGTSAMARAQRGEWAGVLVPIDRTSACFRTARSYFSMRDAAAQAGVYLSVRNGFRTRHHQARLYRELPRGQANPPGHSLHQNATELDIRMRPGGGDRIHRWLQRHARFFGFHQRYAREPWHWGYVRGC